MAKDVSAKREHRDPEANAWDRIPGEPALWYQRFTIYRNLGVRRKMVQVWRREVEEDLRDTQPASAVRRSLVWENVRATWTRMSRVYKWKDRAEAWDEAQREQEEREWEEMRKRSRRDRRIALEGLLAKVSQAVLRLNTENPRWGDVVFAMKVAVDGLRSEFEAGRKGRNTEEGGLPVQFSIDIGSLAAPLETGPELTLAMLEEPERLALPNGRDEADVPDA